MNLKQIKILPRKLSAENHQRKIGLASLAEEEYLVKEDVHFIHALHLIGDEKDLKLEEIPTISSIFNTDINASDGTIIKESILIGDIQDGFNYDKKPFCEEKELLSHPRVDEIEDVGRPRKNSDDSPRRKNFERDRSNSLDSLKKPCKIEC